MRYTALLDANVLIPYTLTDVLLRLAEAGLYRPLWSTTILAEAERTLIHLHPLSRPPPCTTASCPWSSSSPTPPSPFPTPTTATSTPHRAGGRPRPLTAARADLAPGCGRREAGRYR